MGNVVKAKPKLFVKNIFLAQRNMYFVVALRVIFVSMNI